MKFVIIVALFWVSTLLFTGGVVTTAGCWWAACGLLVGCSLGVSGFVFWVWELPPMPLVCPTFVLDVSDELSFDDLSPVDSEAFWFLELL